MFEVVGLCLGVLMLVLVGLGVLSVGLVAVRLLSEEEGRDE